MRLILCLGLGTKVTLFKVTICGRIGSMAAKTTIRRIRLKTVVSKHMMKVNGRVVSRSIVRAIQIREYPLLGKNSVRGAGVT